MAFTIEDYNDLMEVLRQHPEWTAQLRELLVGKQLDEANERLTRIEATLDRVDAQIAELVVQVAEQGRQLALIVERLDSSLLRIDARLGAVEGWSVENQWLNNGRSLLHVVVKKARRVEVPDLDGLEEAVRDGRVGDGESAELARADVLLRGVSAAGDDVVVVVEASKTIGMRDIDRADARTRILQRAGYNAIGVVAGESIRPEDKSRAEKQGLGIFIGGLVDHWPDSA